MGFELRPATTDDIPALAALWYPAWRDGHLGGVPDELVALRTPDDFVRRATDVQPYALVAADADALLGFVAVKDDELDQLFVAAEARGTGVAGDLLHAGEQLIAGAGHERAWLAVVATNARARRFYERHGWVDEGDFLFPADTADGTIDVPCRRYAKTVSL